MYKLVKIKPLGMRVTLIDSTDKAALEEAAARYSGQYPEMQFSVIEA